jgi:hypothetical protein
MYLALPKAAAKLQLPLKKPVFTIKKQFALNSSKT